MALDFSVIIPAYNEEKRIGRAIQSVFNQSLPPQEIIVVDDGSTDNTRAAVEAFGDKVRYIYQENKKLAAARNTGIKNANYEWIALLDSDDEWKPEHLRGISEAVGDNKDVVWACTGWDRRIEGGELEYSKSYTGHLKDGRIIEDYFLAQVRQGLARPSAMAIKKNIFLKVGGFDESIGMYGEDLDMWFRIALQYPFLAYSKNHSIIYWARPNSIMSSCVINTNRFLDRIEKTEVSLTRTGTVVPESAYLLISTWLISAIKDSIREKNKIALSRIIKNHIGKLPVKWQLFCYIFRFLPITVFDILLKLK